ncbi:MAG TPA: acyl-CoA thioesterase [Crocinitomix sp.]|nr:acyl-CoA thioesterase [Crocinitomix sp.]
MITTPIQIRFSDCDMLQHVNNAVYLQYFEISRINFFKSEIPTWDWKKKGIILLKNTVEYKLPLLLTDECRIEVNCIHIGSKSFTLNYNLKVDDNIKCYGESVLVCYDFIENKTIPIPDDLNSVLKKHLITK